MSLFDLAGEVVLVTGAGGGIGSAIALQLGRAGAAVIVSDRQASDCAAVLAEMAQEGITAHAVAADLGDTEDAARLGRDALTWRGRLTALVSNAGTEGPIGPSHDASVGQIDRVIDINLKSALALSNVVAPAMAEAGGGSIVLMSSIAGLRGNRVIGTYGLTKAALAQLARNIAVEWGPQGVRANAVSPGLVETRFTAPLLANPEFLAKRLASTPLRRAAKPEEIAAVVQFLVSRASSFVTGHNLVADGGTLISDGS